MPQVALLSIGELSRRTGLSVSAIRFYEQRGLVTAVRTSGNQRRFLRADIRRPWGRRQGCRPCARKCAAGRAAPVRST